MARDLITTSIECRSDADCDEALNEALELYQRATAWESLKKAMGAPCFIGRSTQQLFVSNYSTFKEDLAPAVEETLAAIVEAADKIGDISIRSCSI